ncbi:MAG: hypothetical protein JWO31_851 [Phycisphaerales bacterium]|nr:hypothetical protein [Phycisphaerales bacterium]
MVAMNEAAGRSGRSRRGEVGQGESEGLVARVRNGAAEAARAAKAQAEAAARQIQQAAGEATHEALTAVRERAQHAYDERKQLWVERATRAGEVVSQTAHALRAVKADQMAEYVDGASERVVQATDYLEGHTLSQIIEDANGVVRRHRAVAVGGMLVAGFAVARFLKASAARTTVAAAGQGDTGAGGGGAGSPKAPARDRSGDGAARPNGRGRRVQLATTAAE